MSPSVPIIDLRHEQVPGHRKTRRVRGRTVMRDPATVTGIVVHQTAVAYGVSERQLREASGSRQIALARRALDVACHAMAFRDGFVALAHPLRAWVNHANGLNQSTLALEIDGLYPGLRDDPDTVPRREDIETTWGGEPDAVTDTIVAAARRALEWLVEAGRAEGMPIEYVYAHRQSSPTRRSDPGQPWWELLVLDYAVPVLGLRTRPELALDTRQGRGRPIPVEWDPAGVGRY